jgi:hypothetical protein
MVFVFGMPTRFWRRVERGEHPFSRHPLLVKHGARLSDAAKQHAAARAREKGVFTVPGIHYAQLLGAVFRILMNERHHSLVLAQLAKQATHVIWGIDEDRLQAEISFEPEVGQVRTPDTIAGRMYRGAAAGWGGVQRHGEVMKVVARAWFWPFLSHELVKGTAELVCLHGLNTLDRETYDAVIDATDRIEYEHWMMQAGSELWRRFLKIKPADHTLAESLMQIARLPPRPLDRLMHAVVEEPEMAAEWLASL